MSQSTTPPPGLRRVTGKETRRASGIAFFAWTIAVYDFILFGTLLPRIEESFGWSTSHALLVSTLVSVGTAIVVLLVGPMVDKLGRRKGMIISVGGTAASSAATAATFGATSLIGVRAISGLGLAEQSVNATYLNELYELTEDEKLSRESFEPMQSGFELATDAIEMGEAETVGVAYETIALMADSTEREGRRYQPSEERVIAAAKWLRTGNSTLAGSGLRAFAPPSASPPRVTLYPPRYVIASTDELVRRDGLGTGTSRGEVLADLAARVRTAPAERGRFQVVPALEAA